MGLLTDRITINWKKVINEHALNRESVPLNLVIFQEQFLIP